MSSSRRRTVRKSIFDPIHGIVAVEGAPLELIGHPAFQRLWGIRQTGFAHLVFPGANHTRLEHSLGAFWVTGKMGEHLGLSPREALTATVGGLLHDLGHGPFSHTLDPSSQEVLGFGHERISRAWITGETLEGITESPPGHSTAIPETLEKAGISPRRVADLVDPAPGHDAHPVLRAMLHGAIDADRIDYLQRDAHYTGVAHGTIDAARLLNTVMDRAGRLVFAEKGRNAVEGFLVGRALMYSSVYFHKTVRSAEVMAQSALERLPHFPEVPHAVFGMTDGEFLAYLTAASDRSADLVRRFRSRQLFKRALAWREIPAGFGSAARRLLQRPSDRRSMEDILADRLHLPPGTVLLDLAGLSTRTSGGDWAEVGLLGETRVTYPFRAPSVWRDLAMRPPTAVQVSVYVPPGQRAVAERRLDGLLRRVL
ncbi:MAG: HD domain-containing protein [Thermoplasmata archaeon]|nr:HD domain-containing protein [Thermoplasmata archaeon]